MEIVIRNKIDRPTSIYKVVLTYMHGDGDAHTYGEFFFKNLDGLKEKLLIFNELYDAHNSEKYDQILEERGLNRDEWCDYLQDDATCQGYAATITNIYVNYFDENGNEYTTDIKK